MKEMHVNVRNTIKLCYLFLLFGFGGCTKKDGRSEAIELRPLMFPTVLKNHTSGADYIISNTQFEVHKKLTIEPGVEIVFESGAGLIVGDSGQLICLGTDAEPVVFRGLNKAEWKGIEIGTPDSCVLKHVSISDAGALGRSGSSLRFYKNTVAFADHLALKNCGESDGIELSSGAAVSLSDVNVDGCFAPVKTCINGRIDFNNQVVATHAKINAIEIISEPGKALKTEKNIKFIRQNLSYFFTQVLYLENHTVSIEPGVTMVFGGSGGIATDYAAKMPVLSIVASSGNPVVMMSEDPSGFWQGISLSQGIHLLQGIRFVNPANAAVSLSDYASATILNCDFTACTAACSISVRGALTMINASAFKSNLFPAKGKICNY